MKISHYSLQPFKHQFISPMKVGELVLSNREGLIFEVQTDNQIVAKGELSPLPGLHPEALSEASEQLQNCLEIIKDRVLCSDSFNLTQPLFGLTKLDNWERLFSSTKFTLEMIFFSLYREQFPDSMQSDMPAISNSLYLPNSKNNLKSSRRIKVKIGRQNIEQDKEMLKKINSQLPAQAKLRLDGNRQLTSSALLELLQGQELDKIDYLEEPLQDLEDWEAVHKKLEVSLALDENLPQCLEANRFPSGTKVWVIKPQLQGGVSRCLELIQKAHQNGLSTVISSCFESSLGIHFLHRLAHYQNSYMETDCGLDTLGYFSKN